MSRPDITVVIPVYNEAGILRDAVLNLHASMHNLGAKLGRDVAFEICLAENGSTDATPTIAQSLALELAHVRAFSLGTPNYGGALRRGIEEARGEFVICEEIDLCDADFHARALALLLAGDCDFVVGSKAMSGASDHRPMVRRVATRVMSGLLRVALDFRGTDTHGLKAFRREAVLPVVAQCVVDRDLFASELVIRAARAGVAVTEIPIRLEEKRAPAINLARRVPRVLTGLAKLTYVIRLGGRLS